MGGTVAGGAVIIDTRKGSDELFNCFNHSSNSIIGFVVFAFIFLKSIIFIDF